LRFGATWPSFLREVPHQTSRHSVSGIATTTKAPKIRGFYQRVGIAVRCRRRLALSPNPHYLRGDFSCDARAQGLGGSSSRGNDRGYCADKGAQLKGATDSATLSRSLELLNLFVGFPVDLIELRTGVVNELSDFIDDGRHALVEVRLIHHSHRVTHIHAMHAIDHVTGVVWIESVGGSADARSCTGVCHGLPA
jgi:hypothetical protein